MRSFGKFFKGVSLVFRKRFASHPPAHRGDTSLNSFLTGEGKLTPPLGVGKQVI
jgi:hypothetical protein